MAINALRTGVVDTSFAGVSITPSRQQAAIMVLKNDDGTGATAATPIVSPHNPINTLKGTTGANILNGSGK